MSGASNSTIINPGPGPTLPPGFPIFDPIRVRMPIVSYQWTIYPAWEQDFWQFVCGFTWEFHPFAWDYLWISCDGYRVEIRPHYAKSTWDTFWVDVYGHVTCYAAFRLFKKTYGKENELLPGLVQTLSAVARYIKESNPDNAADIRHIRDALKQIEKIEDPSLASERSEMQSPLGQAISERFWRWKARSTTKPPEPK